MARAGYRDVVADSFGNRLPGASVRVRNAGTTVDYSGTLFADGTSGTTLVNPLTANSLGYFEFFTAAPATVDLYVTAAGYTALTVANVSTAVLATLDGAWLVDGTVTGAKLLDGTIATADLADASVTTAKLADASVTSAKIVDGTIATADLADASVTTAKLASPPAVQTAGPGTFTTTTTGSWLAVTGMAFTIVGTATMRCLYAAQFGLSHSAIGADVYCSVYWNGSLQVPARTQALDALAAREHSVSIVDTLTPGAVTASLAGYVLMNTAGTLTVTAANYSKISSLNVG